MVPAIRFLFVAFMLTTWISHLLARPLSADEEVMFFPTTARYLSEDTIEVGFEAWLYEKERRLGVTTAFRHYLRLDPDTLSPEEYAEFRSRVRLFLTDSERGKMIPVTVSTPLVDEPRSLGLPATAATGRSSARLVIPAPVDPEARWIDFAAKGPRKSFPGRALLVPAEGLSVVTDIDDTIKHTQVLDRREMLLNTFARPLKPVEGMSDLYHRFIAAAGPSVCFHYVSGGPHQLWPMLHGFLAEHGFPDGSVHLRSIDWRLEVFGDSPGTFGHKTAVIGALFRSFPRRRFILIGDTGEKDPEIYGELAREFGGQIEAILLRNVTGESRDDPRFVDAFLDVPAGLWSLFNDPLTIAIPNVGAESRSPTEAPDPAKELESLAE